DELIVRELPGLGGCLDEVVRVPAVEDTVLGIHGNRVFVVVELLDLFGDECDPLVFEVKRAGRVAFLVQEAGLNAPVERPGCVRGPSVDLFSLQPVGYALHWGEKDVTHGAFALEGRVREAAREARGESNGTCQLGTSLNWSRLPASRRCAQIHEPAE